MIKYILIIASFLLLTISFVFGQKDKHDLANGWYYIIEENKGVKLTLDKSNSDYFLDSVPIIVSQNIKDITVLTDNDRNPYLKIQFDSVGTKAWKFATMKSINRRLGFVFNQKLIQAPKVNSEIDFGMAAIWGYTKDELSLIKSVIESEYNRPH